jgi:alpha-methylacyl-CoA racemase
MSIDGALAGIRVLDLSRLLPGPFCTQVLADLGADVVKVEDPQGGDPLRSLPPLLPDGTSALFHAVNRGKRSVCVDLKSEDGRARFLRLVDDSDVVVESFRPGVMDRLGLSPAVLLERNPQVIVCSISGYGATSPQRERAGHDVNYVARSGALGMMKRPALLPVQVADLAGGAWPAAAQICAALVARGRMGRGAHIDVSMKDGLMGLMALSFARAVVEGPDVLQQGGDLLVGHLPSYGVYATADGFVAVGALEPKFFCALCKTLGLDDFIERPFEEDTARALATAFATRTTADWTAVFAAVDACVEPVLSPAQALDEARLIDVVVEDQQFRFVASGVDVETVLGRRGPRLGEHDLDRP